MSSSGCVALSMSTDPAADAVGDPPTTPCSMLLLLTAATAGNVPALPFLLKVSSVAGCANWRSAASSPEAWKVLFLNVPSSTSAPEALSELWKGLALSAAAPARTPAAPDFCSSTAVCRDHWLSRGMGTGACGGRAPLLRWVADLLLCGEPGMDGER